MEQIRFCGTALPGEMLVIVIQFTPEGREKLRETALRNRPWKFSTGPRTAAGKARVALNGKRRQAGTRSVRELRADLTELKKMSASLREHRQSVLCHLMGS